MIAQGRGVQDHATHWRRVSKVRLQGSQNARAFRVMPSSRAVKLRALPLVYSL